jgi:IMP dehydrogenase/GMP reductase
MAEQNRRASTRGTSLQGTFILAATAAGELRQTKGGKSMATLNAVANSIGSDGTQEAHYVRILAFGKTAENLVKYVNKGDVFGVTGPVRVQRYESKRYIALPEGYEKMTKADLVAALGKAPRAQMTSVDVIAMNLHLLPNGQRQAPVTEEADEIPTPEESEAVGEVSAATPLPF